MSRADSPTIETKPAAEATVMGILWALSLSHLLNDTIQSLIPAIYPVLKDSFHLSYAQIGLITFVFQMTGSMLQPLVGYYTAGKQQAVCLERSFTRNSE